MTTDAESPAAKALVKTRWFAFGALAVAVAALLFVALGGIGENLVYYWGPKELRAAGDKAIWRHHAAGWAGGGRDRKARTRRFKPGVRRDRWRQHRPRHAGAESHGSRLAPEVRMNATGSSRRSGGLSV